MDENIRLSLDKWIQDFELNATIEDDIDVCTVVVKDFGTFLVLSPKGGKIFDQEMNLILSGSETNCIESRDDVQYFLFQFGSRWYYADCLEPKDLKDFKYLGKVQSTEWEPSFPYLGIHGGFDLCNGSRDYGAWCNKAKFLGYSILGICEEKTLGGTLSFQQECEKKGIRSIIGETIPVQWNKNLTCAIKLYVKNELGWKNLLNVDSQVNVFNSGFVTSDFLTNHSEGLYCVLTPELKIDDLVMVYDHLCRYAKFENIFYQLDFAKWDSDERDKKWLNNMQDYFRAVEPMIEQLEPVLISDSFYLDKNDAAIRRDLNAIGKVDFRNQSKDQHFKSYYYLYCEYGSKLFGEAQEQFFSETMKLAEFNAFKIGENEFKIPIGKLRLPKFELTPEQEEEFGSEEALFWHKIEQGLEAKVTAKGLDTNTYLNRIDKEAEVIIKGGFISYFLIVSDYIDMCKRENIWVGIGRGSAAGCLISYLLDIVKIDPIKYNLLFERFLNESRIKKGLPDIDIDFQGSRRDEVKRYIERKYTADHVTCIGTYGTFKVKGAIQDLARRVGADLGVTRYTTGAIIEDSLSYYGIFEYAQKVPQVKKFIQEYPDLIERIPLILDQPKNTSIHAAGMVIVPKDLGTIYDQMPVKLVDGVLVSQWEGEHIDNTGFLKCDILGIKQLDKFAEIAALIEQTVGDKITFDDIELDTPEVYELFGNGYNEDVFQFGGGGLKGYCQKLKPTDIEDLIATVALYRPGPIEIEAHNEYIQLKNGKKRPMYDYGTEEITKSTYGIYCYQEQIMQIVQVVGGLSLVEADEVRKAMGKKIPELMEKYKQIFKEGAVKNGCSDIEAGLMWDKMEGFAGYAFNRSHAACYAITGYYCQWFKVTYPLQFWTVSLRYAASAEIASRLSEINQTSTIRIASVDINKSDITYQPDVETNSIYWAINSIKQVGPEAVKAILQERNEGGHFFSIEEFADRMKKFSRQIKKNTIINLIMAGAFDEIHNIGAVTERYQILERYFKHKGAEIDEDIILMRSWKEFNFLMRQKEISGYAEIDFMKMAIKQGKCSPVHFRTNKQVHEGQDYDTKKIVTVCGIVEWFEVKATKKGDPYFRLIVNDGIQQLRVTVWRDCLDQHDYKEQLVASLGKIMMFTGTVADHFPPGSGQYILSCGREKGAALTTITTK